MPFSDSSTPMNTSLSMLNKHFSAFNVRQHSCRRCIVWWSRLLCVSVSGPCTTISSEMMSTPSIPARAEAISYWYCSLAEQTPKSKGLYQNKPTGVAKVVISLDSRLNSNWWYPRLRSNFLKTLEPFIVQCKYNVSNTSSTVGIGYHLRMIAWFAWLMSTHRQISPLFFGTISTGLTRPFKNVDRENENKWKMM